MSDRGYSNNITGGIIKYDTGSDKTKRLDITFLEKLSGCNLIGNEEYIYIFGEKRYWMT